MKSYPILMESLIELDIETDGSFHKASIIITVIDKPSNVPVPGGGTEQWNYQLRIRIDLPITDDHNIEIGSIHVEKELPIKDAAMAKKIYVALISLVLNRNILDYINMHHRPNFNLKRMIKDAGFDYELLIKNN